MDKEEAVKVVLLLDFGESQVVAAPIEMLEVRLKEGAFRDVRSSAGSNSAEFIHRAMHRAGSFAAFGNFGLMTGNTGIRGALAVGNQSREQRCLVLQDSWQYLLPLRWLPQERPRAPY